MLDLSESENTLYNDYHLYNDSPTYIVIRGTNDKLIMYKY